MFKNLVFASATAALALAATAPDFSAVSEAAAQPVVQSAQFKAVPSKPTPPTRGPVGKPGAADDLKTQPYVDLYGEPYYPLGVEGTPGKMYCMFLAGNDTRPRGAQIAVKNKGDKPAGKVTVQFQFSGGKKISQTQIMNNPAWKYMFEALIPDSAWVNGKASFVMVIDHGNNIAESNEKNNVYSSFCLDPAYERSKPQRTRN